MEGQKDLDRGQSDWLDFQNIMNLEVNYWYEVDHNWGRRAHTYYVPDGKFMIGDKTMVGVEAIANFYKWREGRGERAARHVVTNFRRSDGEELHETRVHSHSLCCRWSSSAPIRIPCHDRRYHE